MKIPSGVKLNLSDNKEKKIEVIHQRFDCGCVINVKKNQGKCKGGYYSHIYMSLVLSSGQSGCSCSPHMCDKSRSSEAVM